MRAIFKPFAIHSAYSPIETIVFFSIIGTLAYFHVLSAIKHSSFFAPSFPATLSPAHALLNHDGQWVSARGSLWLPPGKGDRIKVEMQQIVFTLDSSRQQDINFGLVQLSESVLNATHQLTHTFQSSSGRKYPSICHRPSGPTSNTSLDTKSPCFAPQILASPRSLIQTLTFNQGTRDDFMDALPSTLKSLSAGDNSVRFEVEVVQPVEPIGQMRNGKWIAYAARALVLRFWDLGKKADSLGQPVVFFLSQTIFNLLTSIRHSSHSFGLYPNAHDVHSPLAPFPIPRVQLLAPFLYPLFERPRSSTLPASRSMDAHPYGPRCSNRSTSFPSMYSRLRQTPPVC